MGGTGSGRLRCRNNKYKIQMKAELRTITPEWAKKILDEKNTGNRPVSRLHVDTLAKEISKGKWKVNGDTMCLNGDMLIDGQHRLAAVVQSGISIQAFVIDNLPSDVFDTKDIGRRRSPGDKLGVRGERNACRLAACLLLIDKYMTGRVDKCVTYSNSEIEELLEKYPEARESLQVTTSTKGLLTPSVLDACHYLFSRKNLLLGIALDQESQFAFCVGAKKGKQLKCFQSLSKKKSITNENNKRQTSTRPARSPLRR